MSSQINYQLVEIQTLTAPQVTGRGTISESVTPDLGKLVFDAAGPELFIGDGTNWLAVGGGSGVGFSVGAPILATDNNGMKLTGTVLSAEFADSSYNGIVSTVTQQWSGEKEFLNSLLSYRINLVDISSNCVAGVGANIVNGGNNSCYFGVNAGSSINSGGNNVCVGFESLQNIGTANDVVAIGYRSLTSALSCDGTVAIGSGALMNSTIGGFNVAIGYNSQQANIIGNNNVSLGYQTLSANLSDDNVAIGYNTLNMNTSGSKNIGIGSNALMNHTTGTRNIGVGYNALNVNTSGNDNIAIGNSALMNHTTGSGNVTMGTNAMGLATFGSNIIAIGYESLKMNTSGQEITAIGYSTISSNISGSCLVAVGYLTLTSNTTGVYNTAVGNACMGANTTGNSNTAVGRESLRDNQSGDNNVAIGHQALNIASVSANNTALGANSLSNLLTGADNTAIGYDSGSSYLGAESGNILIGNIGVLNDSNTIRIGTSQTRCFQAGIRGVTPTAADGQLVYVSSTGQLGTVGTSLLTPWLLGGNAGTVSGTNYIGASDNKDIQISTNGVGGYGLFLRTNGRVEPTCPLANVCFGPSAGNPLAGSQNVFFGRFAGTLITSSNCVGIGDISMNNTVGGDANTGVGAATLQKVTGSGNSVLGTLSGASLTTGINNCMIGISAGQNLTTGSSNIFIGPGAGLNITTGSDNVMIYHGGVAGDSAIIRIGSGQAKNFQAGIYGVTTDIGVAIPVLVSPSGQLGTVSSLRKLKDGIVDVDEDTNHEIISKLKPRRFYMKSDETKRLTYGMIVDEVIDVHPDLIATDLEGKPNTIIYSDISIMLLKEVQRCNKVIDKMLTRINGLEKYLELPVMPVEPLVEPLVVVDPVIPVEAVVEPVVVVDPVDNILEDPVDNILEDPVNNVVV